MPEWVCRALQNKWRRATVDVGALIGAPLELGVVRDEDGALPPETLEVAQLPAPRRRVHVRLIQNIVPTLPASCQRDGENGRFISGVARKGKSKGFLFCFFSFFIFLRSSLSLRDS